MLTSKGLDVVDPERLIARQGVLAGSEEHKDLMRKKIRMVQGKGDFAFVDSEKDGFDVGAITARTRSAWDTGSLTIYECQTNAIREELEKCVEKARMHSAQLIWVTGSGEVTNETRKLIGSACGYAVV